MSSREDKLRIISKMKERAATGKGGIRVVKKKNLDTKNDRADSDEDYSDLDDEDPDDYRKGGYHPVRIGEIFNNNRYHVVHKLGWGYFATVWLCWDANTEQFVAVKVQKSELDYQEAAEDEIELLTHLFREYKNQNGNNASLEEFDVVALLDSFSFRGPNGKHFCMVFELMGKNMLSITREHNYRGIPLDQVRVIMKDVMSGLATMHKARMIHTDLKLENILQREIPPKLKSVMKSYKKPLKSGTPLTERTDLENLSKKQLKKLKRKKKAIEETNNTEPVEEKVTPVQEVPMKQAVEPVVDEMITEEPYVPNHRVKIVDLGNSCFVDKQFTDEVQTRQYRAPEVIMGMKYSTPIDVWSAACVAFELATGDFLFNTKDTNVPRDEDHLALIAELVGDFPQKIKTAGKRWHHFFDKYGKFKHVPNLKFWPLESVLKDKYRMSTEDSKLFASFLLPMLVVDPQQRVTAEQCLKHPFLTEQVATTIDVSSVIDKITETKE